MATTTNFGWETPDDTDLVKDGAAAMRTLGNSIDTSFVDLKGGTSGQVLTKASNTDLDYTWTTREIGDITAVVAGTGLTGGGTTGSVTLALNGSSVIAPTIVDAKGDLITATASDTPARLAVGTNGQFLKADSTAATGLAWGAAPASKVINSVTTNATSTVSVSSGTYVDLISVTITPTATSSKILLIFNASFSMSSTNDAYSKHRLVNNAGTQIYLASIGVQRPAFDSSANMIYLDSPASTSALTYKVQFAINAGTTTSVSTGGYGYSLTAMEIAG